MNTMEGFNLDEESDKDNIFDESAIVEDRDEYIDFDDHGSDEF